MSTTRDDLEVGDFVRYGNGRMTWKIEAIQQVIFIIRSGQSGKKMWARREDISLFQKHNYQKEIAA